MVEIWDKAWERMVQHLLRGMLVDRGVPQWLSSCPCGHVNYTLSGGTAVSNTKIPNSCFSPDSFLSSYKWLVCSFSYYVDLSVVCEDISFKRILLNFYLWGLNFILSIVAHNGKCSITICELCKPRAPMNSAGFSSWLPAEGALGSYITFPGSPRTDFVDADIPDIS